MTLAPLSAPLRLCVKTNSRMTLLNLFHAAPMQL